MTTNNSTFLLLNLLSICSFLLPYSIYGYGTSLDSIPPSDSLAFDILIEFEEEKSDTVQLIDSTHLITQEDTNTFEEIIEEQPPKIPQLQLSRHHDKAFRYIKKYQELAINEMNEFDIPASITLAQGLIESGFGLSRMATKYNNHFGVKCTCRRCPRHKCFRYHDDTKYDRFRIYPSAWASYRAHSLLLQKSRYQHLYEFDITDYENWAHELQKSGYASDKKYAIKIIKVIELYKLYQFDELYERR